MICSELCERTEEHLAEKTNLSRHAMSIAPIRLQRRGVGEESGDTGVEDRLRVITTAQFRIQLESIASLLQLPPRFEYVPHRLRVDEIIPTPLFLLQLRHLLERAKNPQEHQMIP